MKVLIDTEELYPILFLHQENDYFSVGYPINIHPILYFYFMLALNDFYKVQQMVEILVERENVSSSI